MLMHLSNGDRAIVDIRKLPDYCLNPSHPRGRYKAQVCRQAAGLQQAMRRGCRALYSRLRPARPWQSPPMPGEPMAHRRDHQATPEECRGKNDMDRASGRGSAAARDMLGAVMKAKRRNPSRQAERAHRKPLRSRPTCGSFPEGFPDAGNARAVRDRLCAAGKGRATVGLRHVGPERAAARSCRRVSMSITC
jgi:hypothetical protein